MSIKEINKWVDELIKNSIKCSHCDGMGYLPKSVIKKKCNED